MDITSCLCGVAAAVYFLTLRWRSTEGRGAGSWPGVLAMALAVAALYLTLPPAVCCVAFLGGAVILICGADRRVELLQSRAVLITGCDSGIGLALAVRLGELGLKVFAGVLDVNGAGARRLRGGGAGNLQVLQLDVTDSAQIDAARRYVSCQVADTGLWGLVNNAGVLRCPADAELQPMAEYRLCMDVNFLSAVKMCQVFLPLLRRSRGRIVNMSSLAGEVPMPRLAAYGASKAALSVFSRVLRMEVSLWGVTVALIQPAGFRTNIFGNSDDVTRYREEILTAVSPEAREDYGEAYIRSLPCGLSRMSHQSAVDLSPVVDDICHALLSVHPKPLYTPGKMGWLLPFLQHYSPAAVFAAIITTISGHTDCKPAGLHGS